MKTMGKIFLAGAVAGVTMQMMMPMMDKKPREKLKIWPGPIQHMAGDVYENVMSMISVNRELTNI